MRVYLGQWYDTLYDGQRTCWIPILRTDKFRDYMKKRDGRFQPRGKNSAHAPWAHLLHGLGISPPAEDLISRRKTLFSDSITLDQYELPIEMDGETFCHIVNLFGQPHGGQISQWNGEAGTCRTPLGTFQWDITSQPPTVAFEPGPDFTPSCTPYGHGRGAFHPLDFGGDTVQHYLNAIELGTSDWTIVLPSSNSPLPARVEALAAAKRRISSTAPLLLTYKWLQKANRIRRRALTNGGADNSFMQDVVRQVQEALDSRPYKWDSAAEVEARFTPNLEYSMRRHNDENMPSIEHPDWDKIVGDCIMTVLEKYSTESHGTWKKALCDAKECIRETVMDSKINYLVSSVRVLPFDPDMDIWSVKGLSISGRPLR